MKTSGGLVFDSLALCKPKTNPPLSQIYFFSSFFSSAFASVEGVEAAGAEEAELADDDESAGAALVPADGEEDGVDDGVDAEGVLVEVDAPLLGALSWPQAASANAADTASSSALFIHVL